MRDVRLPEGTPLDAFELDASCECDAWSPHDSEGYVWSCTRKVGHPQPHVAVMGSDPAADWCATWNDDNGFFISCTHPAVPS